MMEQPSAGSAQRVKKLSIKQQPAQATEGMAGVVRWDSKPQGPGIEGSLLWAWGANSSGQLGLGRVCETVMVSDRMLPLRLEAGVTASRDCGDEVANIRQIGGGGGFSYLLTDSGQLYTCGSNDRGQLTADLTSRLSPVFSTNQRLLQFKVGTVAAGWDYILALTDSGCVLSWGSNVFGQLGRMLNGKANYDAVPGKIDYLTTELHTNIAAGLRHGLSVSEQGIIFAWGHGKRGQLGTLGSHSNTITHVPMPVCLQGAGKPVQVFAGMFHSGCLTDAGEIFLWGCNKYGQCGQEPAAYSIIPSARQALLDRSGGDPGKVVSVSSGWTHLIACTEAGLLYSWGRADLGQLGRSCDKPYDHVPQQVQGLPPVISHKCGSEHTVALTEKNKVFCWGWNEHSICGTEDEVNVSRPYNIPLFQNKNIKHIGCGAGHTFCAS